jgi:type I restriction-modification system DNA methylase subunit
MDAAEYKHVVLGLIFLKCISGAFEERYVCFLAARLAMAGEKLLKAKREGIVCVLDSVALDDAKA